MRDAQHPGLSISVNEEGRISGKCPAGRQPHQVLEALWMGKADLLKPELKWPPLVVRILPDEFRLV